MTRAPPSSTYDDDFFAWTQEQAEALRRLNGSGADVDVVNLAGEIEDLGKRDLREVGSYLTLLLEHLLKIHAVPDGREVGHWRAEARQFQKSAARAFAPSMRQHLDIEDIWRVARHVAGADVADMGFIVDAPPRCPFTLRDLLADPFHLDAALTKLLPPSRPAAP